MNGTLHIIFGFEFGILGRDKWWPRTVGESGEGFAGREPGLADFCFEEIQ